MQCSAVILLCCAALSGCAVELYGNQSTSGGASAAANSSAVVASAAGSNARVAFASGQPVPAGAPGGQLRLSSGSAAGVLFAGVIIAEFLNAIGATAPSQPSPLPPDTRISHTCSCYGYKPPALAEEGAIRDK
jgi:hypothetical protein